MSVSGDRAASPGAPDPVGGAGRCLVCASVAAPAGRLRQVVAAVTAEDAPPLDLVELRLDALEDPASREEAWLRELVATSRVPLVFTCRPSWEGGDYAGPEEARRRLLERAARAGAGYVDVELRARWSGEAVASFAAPVILSHHWEEPRPEDVAAVVERMLALRPAVAKLVAPAREPVDCLPLLRAGAGLVERGQPATAFCMGEAGRPSRALVAAYGGALTYATSSIAAETPEARPVAPGQWEVGEMREALRIDRWRRGWGCCGLVGHPIGHSLSPRILNAAFAAAGADFGYVPLPGRCLDGVLGLAEGWGFRGLSVTMPFKEEAARRCRSLSREAEVMGAVNTLVAYGDGWRGHNTDGPAVVAALRSAGAVEDRRVVVLGAGGAARAAVVSLVAAGARVVVLNRTPDRARTVAELAGGDTAWGALEDFEGAAEFVVNATPVGMEGGPSAGSEVEGTPVPPGRLVGDEVVLDMVYRPPETPLLRAARERGCTVVSGLEMLVLQAAEQYRLWTGEAAPLDAMRVAAGEGVDEG